VKYSLIVISFLILAACKKSATPLPQDPGCISRISIPVTAHTIAGADISTVQGLFSSNGIDDRNFQYFRYLHDTLQTQYPPYTAYDEKLVRVNQYANGLRIFNKDMNYLFLEGRLNFIAGYRSKGTGLGIDPFLTLPQLRGIYLREVSAHGGGSAFKDSCIAAQFGYYDLHSGTSDTTEKLIKAWHLTPRQSSYPEAFIRDDNGALIYYFNGMYTFR
jgi:hypothetical protein